MKLSAIVTTPSTGIFSPALTSTMSPLSIVATGTSSNFESTTTLAVFGCNPINWRMLLAVPSLAFSSSMRPVSTKVIIMADASK